MTTAEAGRVVAYLNAAFPRDALEPESCAIWITEVSELGHAEAGLEAARQIGRNGDRFPSLKEYRQAYRQAFDRWMAGRQLETPDDSVPPPPEAREMFARMRLKGIEDLPVSDSIRPRPVWARWLRRNEMRRLGPDGVLHSLGEPTDEEKHDAIRVLHDWCHMKPDEYVVGPAAMIVVEAHRILEESS